VAFTLVNARENVLVSTSGLSMSCSKTGSSTSVLSTECCPLYELPGSEWIWTSKDAVDYDYCNVTTTFVRHAYYSQIMVEFQSPDAEYFYVNGKKCLSEWKGIDDASSCFTSAGTYQLTFESRHTEGGLWDDF
jgi:hypothetical protein